VGETAEVVTIDSLNLMRARLLIFDVEGMELEAIQAKARLACRPMLPGTRRTQRKA
jgi:hypothetical protein